MVTGRREGWGDMRSWLVGLGVVGMMTASMISPVVARGEGGDVVPPPPPGVDVSGITPQRGVVTVDPPCPAFLNAWWTLYENENAEQWVAWSVLPGMVGPMAVSMHPQGPAPIVYLDSSTGFAQIDVLTSGFDPNPPGYAMRPFQPYTLFAVVEISGRKCTNAIEIHPLPPVYEVTPNPGSVVEDTTGVSFVVTQQHLVDVDVPFYSFIRSPRQCWPIDLGGTVISMCLGGTALAGSDFVASSAGPVWPGSTFAIPAHQPSKSVPVTILEDWCPEPVETINFHATWNEPPSFGLSFDPGNLAHWLFFVPPTSMSILDDDRQRPPCAHQVVDDK